MHVQYYQSKIMAKQLPYKVLLNQLVSVSSQDQFLGSIDKWTAHTNQYFRQNDSKPHRAFSIFLFNSENKLLFQRRSSDKKTFPLCWTNTCCSHPNMIELPGGKKQVQPIRAALHRALERELKMDLTAEKFYFVDKILYKAFGLEHQKFGEYQLDYVFLCKLNHSNVKYEIVKEQISEVQWVGRKDLQAFVQKKIDQGCYFSPWFSKMQENGLLQEWWNQIESSQLKNKNEYESLNVRNYL